MPKYIVRPGQKITHGDQKEAAEHYKAMIGQGATRAAWPAPPLEDYHEGDEIELTEEQAATMPHAVCTPEEWDQLNSPKALQDKGYTKEEAESMVASRKAARDDRKKKTTQRRSSMAAAFGMQPTGEGADQQSEPNPRNAAKFPEDRKPHGK